MTDTTKKQHQHDKNILTGIVREMAASMTGAQSTKHWADDALWFDIPAFASKGVKPALKMFDRVFSGFKSCECDILEEEVTINGDMGIVCTIQKVNIVLKSADTKQTRGAPRLSSFAPTFGAKTTSAQWSTRPSRDSAGWTSR